MLTLFLDLLGISALFLACYLVYREIPLLKIEILTLKNDAVSAAKRILEVEEKIIGKK